MVGILHVFDQAAPDNRLKTAQKKPADAGFFCLSLTALIAINVHSDLHERQLERQLNPGAKLIAFIIAVVIFAIGIIHTQANIVVQIPVNANTPG